jgi:hypothetical protein
MMTKGGGQGPDRDVELVVAVVFVNSARNNVEYYIR